MRSINSGSYNLELEKPRSMRLPLFKKSLKTFNLNLLGGNPPNFSFGEEISLKSPMSNHGRLMELARSDSLPYKAFLIEKVGLA